MKKGVNRVKNRLLKHIWLFILIPIIAGIIGYYTEAQKDTVYTANQEISLGSYEGKTQQYTNVSIAKEILKSNQFLKEVEKKYDTIMPVTEIEKDLSISEESRNVISISLKGSEKNIVKNTLSSIVKAYLYKDKQMYHQKLSLMNKEIKSLKNSKVSPENAYGMEKFIYQLELEKLNMKEPAIVSQISMSQQSGTPLKRAIIDFLVGSIFSLFLLFIPEVLMEDQ